MLPLVLHSPAYLAVSVAAALVAAGLLGYMLGTRREARIRVGYLAVAARVQQRLDAETGTAAPEGWAWADRVGWWRSHPDSSAVRYVVTPHRNRLRGWRLVTVEPSTSTELSAGPWGSSALDAIEQAERRMKGEP